MKIFKLFSFSIFVLFLACQAEHKTFKVSPESIEDRIQQALKDSTQIDFDLIQKALINDNCMTKCHDTANFQGKVDLSEYRFLIEGDSSRLMSRVVIPKNLKESRLYKSILPGGGMPKKAPPLSANKVQLVRLWIENGAPKEQGETSKEEPDEETGSENPLRAYIDNPQLIDYDVIMDNILIPKCISCHSAMDTNEEFTYTSFDEGYEALLGEQLFIWQKLITPNSIEKSYLFTVSAKLEKPYMPPSRKEPLSGDELTILMLWIMNGSVKEADTQSD